MYVTRSQEMDIGQNGKMCYTISAIWGVPKGYQWVCTPKIAVHCTSKGQGSKCDKFPTGK